MLLKEGTLAKQLPKHFHEILLNKLANNARMSTRDVQVAIVVRGVFGGTLSCAPELADPADSHSHSCPSHLQIELLQCTLHGAASEEYLETLAGIECSGMGSYVHS